MKVTFSRSTIDRILCDIDNWILNTKTKRWKNGRHICKCHVCGDILDSSKEKWCPEECGWKRLKDKNIYNPWICHTCLEHHDDFWVKKELQNTKKDNPLCDLNPKEIPTVKRKYKYMK